jgi:hypothetical protein
MGMPDTVTKEYMSDNDHFADLFNYYLFNGEKKIQPSALRELDSNELGIILENGAMEDVQKYRDVLKSCIIREDDQTTYLIFGVENQSDIHYAMVVKNLLYDALNYGEQVQKIASLHRKQKDVRGAEFLSGFKKTDRLKPVLTLTLYWGADPWDGPRSLYEMFSNTKEEILQYISDYHLNLVVPCDIQDFRKFHTELGKALQFIAASKDSGRINELCSDKRFESISNETVNLLNICTGSKLKLNEEGGSVNMCEGLRKFGEEKENEGRREGLKDGLIEGENKAFVEDVENVAESFHISIQEACEKLKRSYETYLKIKETL